jgi:hypothetical protein
VSDETRITYPPLDIPKAVAPDVWIVDGPAIRFGPAWLGMPFPTRMTIVRLAGGSLFLHSPTRLTPALREAVEALGAPRWIVGPNRLHYWWIPDWHAAFPAAEAFLAPRIRERAGGRIDFPTRELAGEAGHPWDGDIATLPVEGGYMTEYVFFHRASRTLVLTDLIENFEPGKLGFWMGLLTRLGGVRDPDGAMPRDMRATFRGEHRAALERAVETMIAWNPERVILAHGRWYERDGAAELKRAFGWVLDGR